MALSDLLRALQDDATAERLAAEGKTAEAATALVEQATQEAAAVEASLTRAPEAEARAEAERQVALARLDAVEAIRAARETVYLSVLDGVRAELASLRDSPSYPAVFRAFLRESRAASPTARRLRVDRRDRRLAASEAEDLEVLATLDSWGGVELGTDDGRTIRNTLEERLSNAESLLRERFASWLTARTEALSRGPR